MRTVYGIQFQVKSRPDQAPAQCIGELRQLAAAWVAGKYRRTWGTEFLPAFDGRRSEPIPGHWVTSHHECYGDCELVSVEWGHPDGRDDSIAWITSCLFARKGDVLHAATSIRLSSSKFLIRPTRFALGRPKIVSDILTGFTCTMGGQAVPVDPTLVSAPGVAGFVNGVLLARDRALPVIVVSPDNWTEKHPVNPAVLQGALTGFGQVAVLADKWAAFKLTDNVGKEMSCFDGAVRVYWPSFALADNPFMHPLYLGRSIKHHRDCGRELKTHLFGVFAGMSAFRAGELGPIREVRRYIEIERDRQLQQLRDEVKAGTARHEDMLAQIERYKAASEDFELRSLELEEKVQQLTGDLEAAQQNVVLMSQQWAAEHQDQGFVPDDAAAQKPQFDSVAGAVAGTQAQFPKTLVFLDSAIGLAAESPFQDPDSVFALFTVLDGLVKTWRTDGKIGTTWKEALVAKGFDYKPDISQTCRQKKFIGDYTFTYDGRRVVCQEHVTMGKGQDPQTCLSVHWYRDEKKKLLAIGRCGKHPRNTLT